MDRVERLTAAVNRVVAEQMPARREALFHGAVNLSIKVAHDRADLAEWLDRAYDWLEGHRDAPDFRQREDAWLAKLATYDQLSASLDDARRML